MCKPLVSLFPSFSRSTYIHIRVSLSLSLSPVHKSTQSPLSFFISKLRLSSSLYPSPLSPHLEQATRSSSSPLHRLNFFSLPRLPTERRIIPSSLIPYASNSYGTFDSSPSPSSPPDIVSVAVKLTRDQWQMSVPRKGERTTFRCKLVPNEVVGINHRVPVIEITRSTGCTR